MILLPALAGLTHLGAQAQISSTHISRADLNAAQTALEEIRQAVSDHYYPEKKVGPAFTELCRKTSLDLANADSSAAANLAIAKTFSSLDPRIRLVPPILSTYVDYGWNWHVIGNAAYVTHVDDNADAKVQGLRAGDRLLAINQLPVDRSSWEDIIYIYNILAPQAGLNVLVQTADEKPRELVLAAKIKHRPHWSGDAGYNRRRQREYVLKKEYRDVKNHIRRIGDVAVWQCWELQRRIDDIADGFKLIRGATALVLDLRRIGGAREDVLSRLLGGLLSEGGELITIDTNGGRKTVRAKGRGEFSGTVIVLIDIRTIELAEVAARILQQRQRAVIVGDRTAGHVRSMGLYYESRLEGIFGARIPVGEIRLADGSSLDGTGVIPDFLLLPKPSDLAGERDIVLAKALAMLKQSISPEEAYRLFPHHEYEDLDEP
jgi:C-terminal processing protease CtpA/Prc